MNAKQILKEKLREAKGLIALSLQLAHMERWDAVAAALDCVWNIFSISPAPHLFKTETIRPIQREKYDSLRALLEKIPARGLREWQRIRDHKFPDALRDLVYADLWARLSIFLDETDSAALPEDDNLLLDIELPLEVFHPRENDFARRMEYPKRFTGMVLEELAWPKPDDALLAAAESVWLDLNLSCYIGVKLSQPGPPILMTREELGRLLSWRQTAADLFGDAAIPYEPQDSTGGLGLIRKLFHHSNELAAAISYEVGPSLYAFTLESFAKCLDIVRKRIHHLARAEARKKSRMTGLGKLACLEGQSGRKNILRLDQAFRLLEPIAKNVIRETSEIVCAKIPFDSPFLPENNRPGIEDITLWTKGNGDLASRFIALPIFSVKYPGADLLCSGDGWSETTEIESMVYLTHILAHDSHISWQDTGLSDYITLRIDCSRQAYRRFKED